MGSRIVGGEPSLSSACVIPVSCFWTHDMVHGMSPIIEARGAHGHIATKTVSCCREERGSRLPSTAQILSDLPRTIKMRVPYRDCQTPKHPAWSKDSLTQPQGLPASSHPRRCGQTTIAQSISSCASLDALARTKHQPWCLVELDTYKRDTASHALDDQWHLRSTVHIMYVIGEILCRGSE